VVVQTVRPEVALETMAVGAVLIAGAADLNRDLRHAQS